MTLFSIVILNNALSLKVSFSQQNGEQIIDRLHSLYVAVYIVINNYMFLLLYYILWRLITFMIITLFVYLSGTVWQSM